MHKIGELRRKMIQAKVYVFHIVLSRIVGVQCGRIVTRICGGGNGKPTLGELWLLSCFRFFNRKPIEYCRFPPMDRFLQTSVQFLVYCIYSS